MEELAYSFHLGSDKNKKNSVRESAKTNISGTTSMSNNAIQNAQTLSKCDKHNYRKYDNEQNLIVIVRGTSSLYKDIQDLYHKEFDNAVLEYNNNQTRSDRKIDNYFKKISDNSKNDLACEIIIELGDKPYWDTKDDEFKKKMTNVYKKQIEDLELLVPNFKVCSAIIHYDETSPHMHIVGVPVKYDCKTGLNKQVGKSDVFTRDSLRKIQDKMRTLCIESFNQEYNLDHKLKQKMKGRNKDINVNDMDNYSKAKEEIIKHQNTLEEIENKSNKLEIKTNEIDKTIINLKQTKLNKNNYILTEKEKENIEKYISMVKDSNNDYKKIKELSSTLEIIDNNYKETKEQVDILIQNNKALELRNNKYKNKVDELEEQVSTLKDENNLLKKTLNKFKKLYNNLFNFLHNKMFGNKDMRDDYLELSKDLYTHGALEEDAISTIKERYINTEINDKKNKSNDFEL